MSAQNQASPSPAFVIVVIAVVAVVSVGLHRAAGYTMPTPWPDEAHFLWQATTFAENNNLHSKELNPDREILWQPPGYFVLVGSAFKIFGAGLATARFLSLGFLITAFVVFCLILYELAVPWTAYLIAGLFWTNSHFVACGNVARMEAPLLLVGLIGHYLIMRKRPNCGLAVLLLTPLIHPNGIFFIAGGLGTIAFTPSLRPTARWRSDRIGWIVVAVAALSWAAYGLHLAQHWSDFRHDMQFQLDRKGIRSWSHELISQDSVRFMVYFLLGLGWVVFGNRRLAPLACIAFLMWALYVAGGEMWYRVLYLLAVLGAIVLIVAAAHGIASRWQFLKSWRLKTLWAAAVALFILSTSYRFRNIDPVWNGPQDMKFCEMTPQLSTPYNSPEDTRAVEAGIRELAGDSLHTLEIVPSADAFMFLDLREVGFDFSASIFCERTPDIVVYHFSPSLPARYKAIWDNGLTSRGLDTISTPQYLIHENPHGEKWYAKAVRTQGE